MYSVWVCVVKTILGRRQKKRERTGRGASKTHSSLEALEWQVSTSYKINLSSYWYLAFSAKKALVTVSSSTERHSISETPEQALERRTDVQGEIVPR